jgi:hypothetical protein
MSITSGVKSFHLRNLNEIDIVKLKNYAFEHIC